MDPSLPLSNHLLDFIMLTMLTMPHQRKLYQISRAASRAKPSIVSVLHHRLEGLIFREPVRILIKHSGRFIVRFIEQ